MGNIARIDPKLSSKCRDMSWSSPPTSPSSNSFFQNDRPEPPPPLNKRAFIVVLAIIFARAINVHITRLLSL